MQTSAMVPAPEARASARYCDPVACAESTRILMTLARRVAGSECTVLIGGESGTGKEVLAHYIHGNSPRAAGPFVAINCAAIPDNMLEAVLFGWERGAFTGAHNAHAGKFEQAQGGTLLLDEVSEIPLSLQAKLLRVLQEREVERLGGRTPIALDVRILATTNRQLREDVTSGRFREDLYYRLNVFPISLLPLRSRREDILPLAMRLLSAHCPPGGRIPALDPSAAHLLLRHPWPGNVRELDNVMQRALVLCDGDLIRDAHIVFEPAPAPAQAQEAGEPEETVAAPAAEVTSDAMGEGEPAGGALADSLAQAESRILLEALRSKETRERIAERLGISPRTLRYKLARLRRMGLVAGDVA